MDQKHGESEQLLINFKCWLMGACGELDEWNGMAETLLLCLWREITEFQPTNQEVRGQDA